MEKEERKERPDVDGFTGFTGILTGRAAFVVPPGAKLAHPANPSQWPVFKIRPQDGLESNEETDDDSLYRFDQEQGRFVVKPGAFRVGRLKRCVLGWKNLRTPDGIEIQYKLDEDGRLSDESVRALPMDLQTWLLEEISRVETVLPEEAEGVKF